MFYVNEILNWISMSLMVPTVVLLLFLLTASLFMLGGFCSMYLQLLRESRARLAIMKHLKKSGDLDDASLGHCRFGENVKLLAAVNFDFLDGEKLIFDLQSDRERELERCKFMMKIGPMLGLMGTLIPMGPALAGLASGDIESMAYNMQIAFATTVIGVVIAGICALIYSVKRHLYAAEIADLEYILHSRNRERS